MSYFFRLLVFFYFFLLDGRKIKYILLVMLIKRIFLGGRRFLEVIKIFIVLIMKVVLWLYGYMFIFKCINVYVFIIICIIIYDKCIYFICCIFNVIIVFYNYLLGK